jgi:hypothetical protein
VLPVKDPELMEYLPGISPQTLVDDG